MTDGVRVAWQLTTWDGYQLRAEDRGCYGWVSSCKSPHGEAGSNAPPFNFKLAAIFYAYVLLCDFRERARERAVR